MIHTDQAATTRPELEAAFRATRYIVETPDGARIVGIGARHESIDALADGRAWCIITADNPGATRVGSAVNRRAWRALRDRLERRHPALMLPTRHVDPSGRWPDESGWLITFSRLQEIDALAAEFGQAAVVIGEPGQPSHLRFYATPPRRTGSP